MTLPLLLVSLWLPMFSGVVQGRQDFFWLGWMQIFGGAGRFIAAAILVLALGFGAAGMMAGAFARRGIFGMDRYLAFTGFMVAAFGKI